MATTEQIRTAINTVGGKGYINIQLSYGFAVVSGGQTSYRPVKVGTGVTINPAHWEKGWFTPAYMSKHKRECSEAIGKIEAAKKKLLKAYKELLEENNEELPTPEQVSERYKGGTERKRLTTRIKLSDYIEEYRLRLSDKGTRDKFRSTRVLVEILEAARGRAPFNQWSKGKGPIYLETFSYQDWLDFCALTAHVSNKFPTWEFTRNGIEAITFGEQGSYNVATAHRHQATLAQVLRDSVKEKHGKHNLTINLSEIEVIQRLSDKKEALQPDELAVWLSTPPKGLLTEEEEQARKLLALCCLCACRFSDLKRILGKEVHMMKGLSIRYPGIYLLQQKTDKKVILPLMHHAYLILSGKRPEPMSNKQINKHVSSAAKKLGLDRIQHVVSHKVLGDPIEKEMPLWEVLSSHGGRRTFLTLAARKLLISRQVCASVTGHSVPDSASDNAYLSDSPEETGETFLMQAHLRAHLMPFQVLPDVVTDQLAKLQRKAS